MARTTTTPTVAPTKAIRPMTVAAVGQPGPPGAWSARHETWVAIQPSHPTSKPTSSDGIRIHGFGLGHGFGFIVTDPDRCRSPASSHRKGVPVESKRGIPARSEDV